MSMAYANMAAEELGEGFIAPRHILLGLLRIPTCSAVAILKELAVDLEGLSRAARKEARAGSSHDPAKLPHDSEAKRVIHGAIDEARVLRDDIVGSEHILLGLLRLDESVTKKIWDDVGVDLARAKAGLLRVRARPVAESRAPEPVGAYPAARRVGNLLFLSGQGPRQRGSKVIPGVVVDAHGKMVSYDMEAQVRAVFQNVRWVLEEHGSAFEKIVDVTCYLTNLEQDFAVYNRVYGELFPPGPNQPCRTTLGISALPQGGNTPIAFEVKVVAMV